MIKIYRIGRTYKLELNKTDNKGNSIIYTGKIIEEDSIQIRIETTRQEEIVLAKSEIRQSKIIDSIGDNGGKA